MAVAVAVWSLEVMPGEPTTIEPPSDVRITNVALGEELDDATGRTTVKLIYSQPSAPEDDEDEDEDGDEEDEDEEKESDRVLVSTVLCSLTPGKIEQATIDVILDSQEEYLIEIVGKNTVYLTGNYIDQTSSGPFNDEFEDEFDDEDGYNLRHDSLDVQMDAEEIDLLEVGDAERFEEVDEEAPKADAGKKRPRESDADAEGEKLSKAQKKKQKKQKGENGQAVPDGTEESTSAKEAPAKEAKKDKKEKKKAEKEGADKKGGAEKELPGGIKIKDHTVGSGPQAKKGSFVSMRYVGKLQNGKVFDQNTKGAPFKFRLGKGEVIKGWDEGIVGMQVGGERLLTVPPKMGYGNKAQSSIPANSTLIFEVKLLKID